MNKQEGWAIRYTLDRTSRKWHPKLSSDNIYDFEQRLYYVEEELRRKKTLSDDPPDDKPAFEE